MGIILQFLADSGALAGTPVRIDCFTKEFYFEEKAGRQEAVGSLASLPR
jgi:hypothetical protein